jgi:hypothetical protein
VDTGTGWVRVELWMNQWDGSGKQPTLLSLADTIFFLFSLVPFPLVYLAPFPLNPSSFFFHSFWYPMYIFCYFSLHFPYIPPAPINVLLSSVLCHSLYLQLALLRKIRFVAFPACAPDITLTELSHLCIRHEKVT